MLSILIPVRNEYENLEKIESTFREKFKVKDFEVLIINDFSTDNTLQKAKELSEKNSNLKVINNKIKGLGGAINLGISESRGEYICIMMADFSDSLDDMTRYFNLIKSKNLDAVFGSRFIKGSTLVNYPKKKLILNRIFNYIVKILFFSKYNDFTNAFKIYKASVIKSFLPFISESFNIFLEIPLKIISRNYSYEIIPISWKNRSIGEAKFNIKELRAKYIFTLIYCLIEKYLLKKKK
tara:strand:- start:731 stop:1444 length:714 start_codon:yes stop_codon:yes gene_type:complete